MASSQCLFPEDRKGQWPLSEVAQAHARPRGVGEGRVRSCVVLGPWRAGTAATEAQCHIHRMTEWTRERLLPRNVFSHRLSETFQVDYERFSHLSLEYSGLLLSPTKPHFFLVGE